MKNTIASPSLWHRLRKNKSAMIGIVIIIVFLFIGIFAYLIAPDATPNADRQMLEIQAKKPGFTQQFILVKKSREIEKSNWFQTLLFGKEDPYQWIPISNYENVADSIIVQRFIDEGLTERRAFSKNQLAENPVRSKTFWLGTDKFGRDILSRLMLGVRVSMAVGLITALISLSIGILLGSLAGYFGGRIDQFIMWLVNVVWSIPTLLLVFGLTLTLGKGFWQIFLAVGLTMWVSVARVVRGQIIAVKELEYIQAARALGFGNFRIIFRHILPNIMGPIWVLAAANFASAIIIEAGLSFLGIGVQPPIPSWGLMIKENYNFIITNNPALALVPGIAIMLLVLAFNFLGNGLRDAMDVRLKQ